MITYNFPLLLFNARYEIRFTSAVIANPVKQSHLSGRHTGTCKFPKLSRSAFFVRCSRFSVLVQHNKFTYSHTPKCERHDTNFFALVSFPNSHLGTQSLAKFHFASVPSDHAQRLMRGTKRNRISRESGFPNRNLGTSLTSSSLGVTLVTKLNIHIRCHCEHSEAISFLPLSQ